MSRHDFRRDEVAVTIVEAAPSICGVAQLLSGVTNGYISNQ